MLGDMPGVTAADLDRLIAAFAQIRRRGDRARHAWRQARQSGDPAARAVPGGRRGSKATPARGTSSNPSAIAVDRRGDRRQAPASTSTRRRRWQLPAACCRIEGGFCVRPCCARWPTAVLPDISPQGARFGCQRRFRQSHHRVRGAASQSPLLRGRCPAGQRGAKAAPVAASRSLLLAALLALAPVCRAASLEALQGRPLRLSRACCRRRTAAPIAVVDYREARDINERDEVPERRVQAQLCLARRAQAAAGSDADDRLPATVRHFAVGRTRGRVDSSRSTCTGRAAAASRASTTSPSAAISTASRT